MSGKVRAEASARLLELIATLGGSPERVLTAAGVAAADLADLDRPIEIETVMRFVDAAAHEMGDDCFGLHAGSLIDFGVLGVLTYAVLNAPTGAVGSGVGGTYARVPEGAVRFRRTACGVDPVQRLNARPKALSSEYPTRKATSVRRVLPSAR